MLAKSCVWMVELGGWQWSEDTVKYLALPCGVTVAGHGGGLCSVEIVV